MRLIKAAVALGLLMGNGALAASVSSTVTITANVLGACSISTPPSTLAFGSYNVYATTPTAGTSTFTVQCTSGTVYTMKLAGTISAGFRVFGTKPPGSVIPLKYSLSYFNGTTQVAWGDGTNGAQGVQITSAGSAPQSYTIQGSIPAQQDVMQGAYSDTVSLTIDY